MTMRRWAVTAVVLSVGIALAPWPIARLLTGTQYADVGALQGTVDRGIVALGAEGSALELEEAARFWAAFHGVKAALAVALLVVLMGCGVGLLRSGSRMSRTRWWLCWTGNAAAASVALLVAVANVQGVVAPLASVLGLRSMAPGEGPLRDTLAAIHRDLLSGSSSAATDLLVAEHVRYHVAMVTLGGIATAALLLGATLAWRHRRQGSTQRTSGQAGPPRMAVIATCLGLTAFAVFFGVVTVANVTTALNPRPTLAATL